MTTRGDNDLKLTITLTDEDTTVETTTIDIGSETYSAIMMILEDAKRHPELSTEQIIGKTNYRMRSGYFHQYHLSRYYMTTDDIKRHD